METNTEKKNIEEKDQGGAVGSVIGMLVLAVACGVGGWIANDLWPKKPPQMPMPPQTLTTVAVKAVEERVYNPPEEFVAHVEALEEIDLLPQVDGYIKVINFKEGEIVNADKVLYELDDTRYRAVVDQRKADLKLAQAEVHRAERYWERIKKTPPGSISDKERDDAESEFEKAKASVHVAEANLKVAEYDLEKTKVTAKISGKIGKTNAHIGDYVGPTKGPLAHIVQIDPIRVSFPLPDRAYIAWRDAIKEKKAPDSRLRLILPNGREYDKEGSWDFDNNEMNRETATISMRLTFPNPDRLLVPNGYVRLLSDSKNPPKMPYIPQQALVDLPGGNQGVWIVKDDNTVEQRIVKVGEMSEGWCAVVEGLTVGEKIAISGTGKLATGMAVQVVEPSPNADIDPSFKPKTAE